MQTRTLNYSYSFESMGKGKDELMCVFKYKRGK